MITVPETTPLEPTVTLPSPIPSASSSADEFHVVVSTPVTIQPTIATPLVAMTWSPSTALPFMPVSLPVGAEDSLLFSFEAASGIRRGSGDSPSSGSTPSSSNFRVTS